MSKHGRPFRLRLRLTLRTARKAKPARLVDLFARKEILYGIGGIPKEDHCLSYSPLYCLSVFLLRDKKRRERRERREQQEVGVGWCSKSTSIKPYVRNMINIIFGTQIHDCSLLENKKYYFSK